MMESDVVWWFSANPQWVIYFLFSTAFISCLCLRFGQKGSYYSLAAHLRHIWPRENPLGSFKRLFPPLFPKSIPKWDDAVSQFRCRFQRMMQRGHNERKCNCCLFWQRHICCCEPPRESLTVNYPHAKVTRVSVTTDLTGVRREQRRERNWESERDGGQERERDKEEKKKSEKKTEQKKTERERKIGREERKEHGKTETEGEN